MVIYPYSCCCKTSYIGLTSRHLWKRIKEHVPKSVENVCFSGKKNDKLVKVLYVPKRSSIAENLVKNLTRAKSHNLNRFKIVKTCSNVFDLIKLEAICTL